MFERGEQYSRADVYEVLGVPDDLRGGQWESGYREYDGAFYLFVNVGVPGSTGHDYENKFLATSMLSWYAKDGTQPDQPQMQRLLSGTMPVHIFWRSERGAKFTYAGQGRINSWASTSPVRITWLIV